MGTAKTNWIKRHRWLVTVIGVFLLLSASGASGLALYHRWQYTPTGDKLFDTAMRWTIREHHRVPGPPNRMQEWMWNHFDWYKYPTINVNYESLLALEEEYGSEIRYWQLLAQVNRFPGVYEKYPENDESIVDQDRINTLLSVSPSPDGYGLISWRRLAFDDEQHALALVEQAIASDPENSYFYYCKADVLEAIGDWELAWDAVRQGNNTAKNYAVQPYPIKSLIEYKDTFRSQDSQTAASILWLCCNDPSRYIMAKERYKELCCMCAWGAPLEMAEDYLIRARRLAQMDGQTYTGQVVAAVLAWILVDYLSEECLELTPEQLAELDCIRQVLSSPYDEALTLSESVYMSKGPLPPGAPVTRYVIEAPDLPVWNRIKLEIERTEARKPNFNILDPPPFATWARGELVGIETGDDAADRP